MPSLEIKTNSQVFSVGVIGTGGMGTRHASQLHRAAGSAVTAVYDLDQERARQVAGFAVKPVFDDPERLINDLQVDAVMIVSPDDTHARLTLACLQAGKPVLSENRSRRLWKTLCGVAGGGSGTWPATCLRGINATLRSTAHGSEGGCGGWRLGRPLLFKGIHRNAAAPYGITETILINSAGHDFDSACWLMGEEAWDSV